MKNHKVSVIIPSFNYDQFIGQCIDSVLDQDYKNIEVIIVDDCSSDSSREIIESYGSKIKYLFHDVNSGHGATFNSGFSISSGDIIMFLDADDFLLPGAVSTIVNEYSSSAAIYAYYLSMVDQDGKPYDQFPAKNAGLDSGNVVNRLCNKGYYKSTVTSGMAFSRESLQKVLPMNSEDFRQGGDGYLAVTVPFYGLIKVINIKLAAYRQHSENHSNFNSKLLNRAKWCLDHNEKKNNYIRMHAKINGQYVRKSFEDYCLPNLEQMMVVHFLSEDGADIKKFKVVFNAIRTIEYSNIRWVMIGFWWFLLGILPKSFASIIFLWKLDAKSRPYMFRRLIRLFK